MVVAIDNAALSKIMPKRKSGDKPKKGDPLMFRTPTDEFGEKFALAMKAANLNQSELLRTVVELKLDEVVQILEAARKNALQDFLRYGADKKKQ